MEQPQTWDAFKFLMFFLIVSKKTVTKMLGTTAVLGEFWGQVQVVKFFLSVKFFLDGLGNKGYYNIDTSLFIIFTLELFRS